MGCYEAELAVLNPIVLALAKGAVTLEDIETLDAAQATWLVAARARKRRERRGRRVHQDVSLGRRPWPDTDAATMAVRGMPGLGRVVEPT